MHNARKYMFFQIDIPEVYAFFVTQTKRHTWMCILKDCMCLHTIQRYKKAFWEIGRLIPPSIKSRCFTNMNVGTLIHKGPYVPRVAKPDLGNVT